MNTKIVLVLALGLATSSNMASAADQPVEQLYFCEARTSIGPLPPLNGGIAGGYMVKATSLDEALKKTRESVRKDHSESMVPDAELTLKCQLPAGK